MQAASDVFLGWIRATGLDGVKRDFYVRQLWDWKASADVDSMDAASLKSYAEICGWTLARAHARSGDRIALAAYLGSGDVFDRAMADFAEAYADQNERDYAAVTAPSRPARSWPRPASELPHGHPRGLSHSLRSWLGRLRSVGFSASHVCSAEEHPFGRIRAPDARAYARTRVPAIRPAVSRP